MGGYGYYGFFYDPTFILVVIGFVLSLIAQLRVKSTYGRYAKVMSSRGLTAERAAQKVLDYYGIKDVQIVPTRGNLTDNYNPKTNVISLSESVYGKSSIAAIGVACHEAGHAAQHAEGYVPIKLRNAIIPACNIGSTIGIPIAILGAFLNTMPLVYFGLLLYGLIAVFQFVTLPVEFNASRRAIKVIGETDILSENERRGAVKVLKAAAMTYVAALATAILNLLRLFIIFGVGRRDDD
ncbi:MAG: zinc metallopeptidase [Oscillospiraceae bacterium]|nr:zinc metallopeptidase [Oscillospiraceae bacterium]